MGGGNTLKAETLDKEPRTENKAIHSHDNFITNDNQVASTLRANVAEGDVASVTINGETTYYTSIKDAVVKANVSGNATITLLQSTTTSERLDFTKSATLDLNGNTLSCATYFADDYKTMVAVTTSGAKLTIMDSIGGGKLDGTGTTFVLLLGKPGSVGFTYTSSAEISGGTVSGWVRMQTGSSMTVSGGTVENNTSSSTVEMYTETTLNVSGGQILNTYEYGNTRCAINNGGTVNITGGTVSGYTGVTNRGTANISDDANITGTNYSIKSSDGTLAITGGSYTGGMMFTGGTATISGGTITESTAENAVEVYGSADLTISGGTIGVTSSERYATGVYVHDGGTVKIAGGTITSTAYGVYNQGGNATITGGSISGGTVDLYVRVSDSILNLTLDEGKTVGATFPDGITVEGITLAELLATDAVTYWGVVDGKNTMLTVADAAATGITDKGDITIRAICDHSGNTNKPADNENGTHSFTCTVCQTAVTEDHTGGSATCKEKAKCEHCGASYGDLNPDNHEYEKNNGICCDTYQPAVDSNSDGYYEISNAGQLFWFANYINTVDRTASAVLTADIDLENRPWTPIGSTGENSNNFRGHFDGANHTITNLYIDVQRAGLGFFGEVRLGIVENFTIYGDVKLTSDCSYVGGVIGSAPGANGTDVPEHNGATIRNITSHVNVTLYEGSHGSSFVGGFMGYANHETIIENCSWHGTLDLGANRADSGVGGLVGRFYDGSDVTIRNCAAYGTIKTSYKSGTYNNYNTIYIGGFVSFSPEGTQTVLENNLWAGKIINNTDLEAANAHLSAYGTMTDFHSITNCYALNSTPYVTTNNENTNGISTVTAEQLASGEVAYLLQGEQETQVWGQNIDNGETAQTYPVLGGAKVYKREFEFGNVYSNLENFTFDIMPDGKCGERLYWKIEDDVLTIFGTGAMWDYSATSDYLAANAPWYENESPLKTLVLEEGMTHIGDYAFYLYKGFDSSLTIPNSVTSIGSRAFYGCSGFTGNLIIPNSVTSIGSYAFTGCSGFTGSLIIPNNVTNIGELAFDKCKGFNGSLIIGNGLTTIEERVFAECDNFTDIFIYKETKPTIGMAAFFTAEVSETKIYVPVIWEDFTGIPSSRLVKMPTYTSQQVDETTSQQVWVGLADGQTEPNEDDHVAINAPLLLSQQDNESTSQQANSQQLIANSLRIKSFGYCGDGTTTNGSITIEEGGQLYCETARGEVTVRKEIIGYAGQQTTDNGQQTSWYTIASPLKEAIDLSNSNTFITSTPFDLYRYDEPTYTWQNAKPGEGSTNFQTIDPGRGYLYANAENTTLEFTGNINTEDVNYTLTADGDKLTGFHLVGNPFTHDITFAHLSSDVNLANGYYVLNGEGAWGATLGNNEEDVIKVGQGALIKTTEAGNLAIAKKSIRQQDNETTSRSQQLTANSQQLSLTVSNANHSDRAFVVFDKGVGLDKINHENENIPLIYIPQDGTDYAIAMMDENVNVIPVNFETNVMGQYTISLQHENCEFEELYLLDKETGNKVNILEEDYTFMATSSDNPERFVLQTGTGTGNGNFAYVSGEELIIGIQGEVQIVDILGRVVYEDEVSNDINRINVSAFNNAAYIIRVVNEEGVKVQKLIVNSL